MLKTIFPSLLTAIALSIGTAQATTPAQQITAQLKTLSADMPIQSITETPIKGLYQVTVEGGLILFSSVDGKYLLKGEMLELTNGELVNLTQQAVQKVNAKRLADIDRGNTIVYPAKGKTEHVIYVFTDITCGYCRKLHQEVPQLNAAGIEVRYLTFPRAGENSQPHQQMATALCSKDSAAALGDLKSGKQVTANGMGDMAFCRKLVMEQFQLGQEMGVNGTPAIFLSNGKMVPGYRPAQQLIELIKAEAK